MCEFPDSGWKRSGLNNLSSWGKSVKRGQSSDRKVAADHDLCVQVTTLILLMTLYSVKKMLQRPTIPRIKLPDKLASINHPWSESFTETWSSSVWSIDVHSYWLNRIVSLDWRAVSRYWKNIRLMLPVTSGLLMRRYSQLSLLWTIRTIASMRLRWQRNVTWHVFSKPDPPSANLWWYLLQFQTGLHTANLCQPRCESERGILSSGALIRDNFACHQVCLGQHVYFPTGQYTDSPCSWNHCAVAAWDNWFILPNLWLPNSPDLNPVDYMMWGVMEQRVTLSTRAEWTLFKNWRNA